jgi:uncharacterized protein (DUF779 family)
VAHREDRDRTIDPNPDPAIRLPTVIASPRARALLDDLYRDWGPQAIVLPGDCTKTSRATVLSRCAFEPDEHHLLLGVVAHCWVYSDIRNIELCPHDALLLDLT